jgi:hypothetical protein
VVDQAGAPVALASVQTATSFGGSTLMTSTATTGADGWALFSRSTQSNRIGTYTATVTSVSKPGASYDASLNVKSAVTYTLTR